MGGGSSGPSHTSSTNTTTNLPEYVKPYFENLLQRGQAESYRDYTPYEAPRIAGFTPGQTQAQQGTLGLQTPGQYGAATGLAQAGAQGSLTAGQYNPTAFTSQQVTDPSLNQYQIAAPEQFGQAQADQYMSPYMQSVVDATKREAITDAQKTQLMQNLGAARQGTYGGARQLLAGTERERALGMNLSDIQAKGLQSAYENAQQQFERDRMARMGVGQANQQAQLQTQQLGSQNWMQRMMANQNADLQAQQAAEQSRQYGGDLGMRGFAQAMQGAQTLGSLGESQQQSDLARLAAQNQVGGEQQMQQQRYMDTAYADFLRQRDYPMEQLNYYNSLLHGLPVTMGSTSTTYAQPPSMLGQVAGAGLGALSLSKLMGT